MNKSCFSHHPAQSKPKNQQRDPAGPRFASPKGCPAQHSVWCTPIPTPASQFTLQSHYPTKRSHRVTFSLFFTEFSVFALLVVFPKSESAASVSQEWQRDTFRRISGEQASHAQHSWPWHLSSIKHKTEQLEASSDVGDRLLRTNIWVLST